MFLTGFMKFDFLEKVHFLEKNTAEVRNMASTSVSYKNVRQSTDLQCCTSQQTRQIQNHNKMQHKRKTETQTGRKTSNVDRGAGTGQRGRREDKERHGAVDEREQRLWMRGLNPAAVSNGRACWSCCSRWLACALWRLCNQTNPLSSRMEISNSLSLSLSPAFLALLSCMWAHTLRTPCAT